MRSRTCRTQLTEWTELNGHSRWPSTERSSWGDPRTLVLSDLLWPERAKSPELFEITLCERDLLEIKTNKNNRLNGLLEVHLNDLIFVQLCIFNEDSWKSRSFSKATSLQIFKRKSSLKVLTFLMFENMDLFWRTLIFKFLVMSNLGAFTRSVRF